MKVRTLIVDDEPIARKGLRGLLKARDDIEIIGECGDGVQAVEEIQSQKPDLVLLDIQMPELNGFEVIEALGQQRMPFFIFVTAYDEFALRAFEVHALDYLLKPVKAPLLAASMDRAREFIQSRRLNDFDQKLAALLQDVRAQKKYVERLLIKSADGVILIKAEEVDWFEAQGDYVRLHTRGRKFLLRERMSLLEARLAPARFARIHRSIIVKLDAIKEMHAQTNGDYTITLTDGTSVPLSRTYRERLFQRL